MYVYIYIYVCIYIYIMYYVCVINTLETCGLRCVWVDTNWFIGNYGITT